MVAQTERTEFAAINFGARNEDALRDELAVDGVPVDVVIVPILVFLLAKKEDQGIGIAVGCNHKNLVALVQHRVSGGNRHLSVAPQAGNHKLQVAHFCHILHRFVENRRVVDNESRNIGFVFCLGLIGGDIGRTDKQLAHEQHGDYHAHDTERIGYGAAESGRRSRHAELDKRLLHSRKRRGVGAGATHHAHDVGQRHSG